jgi:hypothetical protein
MLTDLKLFFYPHTTYIDSDRVHFFLRKQGFFRTLLLEKDKLYFIYVEG